VTCACGAFLPIDCGFVAGYFDEPQQGCLQLETPDAEDELAAEEPRKKTPTHAAQLVALAEDADLFATPGGEPFASFEVGGHRETWSMRVKAFKSFLAFRFYKVHGKSPSAGAMQDALSVLTGRALFESDRREVHVRLAAFDDAIYVDLADEDWRVVEVTAAGWRVLRESPVHFRRVPRVTAALPEPVPGGAITDLRRFLNVGSDEDWVLMLAWLTAALRPRGPFPILALHGEQGTAKSTTGRVLRALVDPNAAPLRTAPRDERDLMIAATNGWMVAYDNLSRLWDWLSDALCRLATGGGFATRMLYTDDEEIVFDAMRPAIINGIEELATRGDLLDRSLLLHLPRIGESERRDEETFWMHFAAAQPALLGSLLDVVSSALHNIPSVELDELPRMADFAKWSVAASPALGWEPATFLGAYNANRTKGNEIAVEASLLGEALQKIIGFEGTASELLKKLAGIAGEETTRTRGWPRSPQALSGALRRLAPNLRAIGIEVEFHREARKRLVIVRTVPQEAVTPVTPVTAPDAGDASDAPLQAESLADDLERLVEEALP
jgi:hypothetical protein